MGRRAHVCAGVKQAPAQSRKNFIQYHRGEKMFGLLPARMLLCYRKHIVLLTDIITGILPVCTPISSVTSWEYVLFSKLRLVVLCLMLAALTLATHASTTNTHPYCAICLLPLSCIAACLIHVGPVSPLTCILTLALVFLSAIIAMRTKASRPVRFIAQLRCTDEGALGGRTQVKLISANERIGLLLGEFRHARTVVDCGRMPFDDVQLSWIDAHTLAMNETRIQID